MSPISDSQKSEIITLIRQGKLSTEQIAAKMGVSPGTVAAYTAHVSRGTYAEPSEAEIEALETTFGLERDLQKALRSNIEQLEKGLMIIDGGKELTTEAGRIDITAEDQQGNVVVIELKPGDANPDCIAQILSYMGALGEKKKKHIRGILVAGNFPSRVVFAARAAPSLQLEKYNFKFSFETIK